MVRLATAITALLSASMVAMAADDEIQCSRDQHCPKEKPCCGQAGICGTGDRCLGGCDPLASYTVDSCAPMPICKSGKYNNWKNTDNFQPNGRFLGNTSEATWMSSGTIITNDGNLLLTMAKDTKGSLLAYNHYIWYGKVTAKMKTSREKGVVTGFILMSDVKDEIDWESVGSELTAPQTNYYWQGVLDYTNGGNASTSDTFENWHTFGFDWKPDELTWLVDGKEVRKLKKEETYNETSKIYQYPQTPSRLQLSLWPGGDPDLPEGTREWAGGDISWDTDDIKDPGYYYATFAEIEIECYDPPEGAEVDGDRSYVYIDDKGLESSVKITDKDTVLASWEATGLNMTAGAEKHQKGEDAPSSSSDDDFIIGAGARGQDGSSGSDGSGGSPTVTGFSQGDSPTPTDNMAPGSNERMLQGSSMFAVLVAMVALIAF